MARINKELVAMNLLTCPTSKEAAEKSGISVPTLYRLKKDTAFQSVLQKVKDNIFGETMHKAQGYFNSNGSSTESISSTSLRTCSNVTLTFTLLVTLTT